MPKKIVLIGAGSVKFTQGLVADLIQTPQLAPWTLGLVDIDPLALKTAELLTKKMVAKKNAEITVRASLERGDLLPKADIVVTTIAVGGRRAWEKDVFIPRKYGIYQPVGDTTMPGGISRALRMIPAMLDIAEDIYELCPDALFINYSNPLTACCRAVRKKLGISIIGLCHGVPRATRYMAETAGLDPEKTSFLSLGLNHLTFIIDFRYEGRNVLPSVVRKLDKKKGKLPRCLNHLDSPRGAYSYNSFSCSFFRDCGAFPVPNDRHVTEFFPEYFPRGEYYEKKLGVDAYPFEKGIESEDQIYIQMQKMAENRLPLDRKIFHRRSGEHEQLVEIIDSIEHNRRQIYSVNLPNMGLVDNLPSYAVLEFLAVATGRGFLPLKIANFPDELAAIVNKHVSKIELTVEAALKGERRLFVEALLSDGSVRDRTIAGKLADEFLEAHKKYLPQFS